MHPIKTPPEVTESSKGNEDCEMNQSLTAVDNQRICSSVSPSYAPAENKLVGTSFNYYLSTFLNRMSIEFSFIVDMEAIQEGVQSLAITNPHPRSKEDIQRRASFSYLMSLMGVGALQCGAIDRKMKKELYSMMTSVLQPCSDSELFEVFRAHVFISFYCLVTLDQKNHKKHIEFSDSLERGLQIPFAMRTAKGFIRSFVTASSLSLPSVQLLIVNDFLIQVGQTTDTLKASFPRVGRILDELAETAQELNPQLAGPIHYTMTKGNNTEGGAVALFVGAAVFWFQQVLSDDTIKNKIRLEQLLEINALLDTVTEFYQFSYDKFLTPSRESVGIIQVFVYLLSEDYATAQQLVREQVNRHMIDTFLCVMILTTPVLLHQYHLFVFALSIMDMTCEYKMLKDRFNSISYKLTGTPVFPEPLPISSHGFCDDPVCMKVWHAVSSGF